LNTFFLVLAHRPCAQRLSTFFSYTLHKYQRNFLTSVIFFSHSCEPNLSRHQFRWLLCMNALIALRPLVGPWSRFQFLDLFIQSVGLLGGGISPSRGRHLGTQDSTNTDAHRHPCVKWVSNPRSQRSSERRQSAPHTALSLDRPA
jgi:hypothetical protein